MYLCIAFCPLTYLPLLNHVYIPSHAPKNGHTSRDEERGIGKWLVFIQFLHSVSE